MDGESTYLKARINSRQTYIYYCIFIIALIVFRQVRDSGRVQSEWSCVKVDGPLLTPLRGSKSSAYNMRYIICGIKYAASISGIKYAEFSIKR